MFERITLYTNIYTYLYEHFIFILIFYFILLTINLNNIQDFLVYSSKCDNPNKANILVFLYAYITKNNITIDFG